MTTIPATFPNVATARARLAEHGIDAHDLQGKALKQAYADLRAALATATPTPAPAEAPAEVASEPTPGNFPLCGCGCGVPTVTAKARFLSGHDARYAGMVGRGEADLDPRLSTPALEAKIAKIRETANRKQAEKAAKEAAREAAKVAYAEALANLG